MKKPRPLVIILVLLAVILLWWLWQRGSATDGDGIARRQPADLLLNRPWIENPAKKPKDKRTFKHAFMLINAVPVGVFQRASQFRLEAERCEHDLDDDTLKLRFPQTEKRAVVHFRIDRCNDVPDYDLCLTLDRNPWTGPRKFYGQRRPKGAGAKLMKRLMKRLSAAAATAATAKRR